jgi:hypothetical protein
MLREKGKGGRGGEKEVGGEKEGGERKRRK